MRHNDEDVDFHAIQRRCQCRVENAEGQKGRRPPLRIYGPAAEAIRNAGILNSSTPFESYRCPTCKGKLYLTAGDCGLGRST